MIHSISRRRLTTSLLSLLVVLFAWSTAQAQTPVFNQIVVFGDSLSDDGNVAHLTRDDFGISYPGGNFNYSDFRFTNSSDTDPASDSFAGTWHEQLARDFLMIPVATNSLDGGTDYAFGGGTTEDGTTDRTVISNPEPFAGGDLTLTVDNMGKQVDDYLNSHTPSTSTLYILWGGGNDLFDDDSSSNVSATVGRVVMLLQRLVNAGARNFVIPNVPPLGAIPHYNGDSSKATELDTASLNYRRQLQSALDTARTTLAGQGISINLYPVDVWSLFVRLAADPATHGFTNVTDSAQDQDVDPDQYLFWDDIHPTTAGHYQIAKETSREINSDIEPAGKPINLSTRVAVGTGENVAIGGFIINGSAPKKVILRAIGPSLSSAGVPGALADPTLSLYNKNHTLLAFNDNWKDTQQAQITATGIPPKNDLESAIVATLDPGAYTAILNGKNDGTGIGLIEVYDLNGAADSSLGNVSTRGFVGTGDSVLIGGFIVGTGDPSLVVVRGLGPALSSAGILNPLADPALQLFDKDGNVLFSDNDWKDTQESAIRATGLAPTSDKEAAIVAFLPAGNYTAVLRGVNNATGVAIVETYRVQ